jgi:hypothetical protein
MNVQRGVCVAAVCIIKYCVSFEDKICSQSFFLQCVRIYARKIFEKIISPHCQLALKCFQLSQFCRGRNVACNLKFTSV